MTFTTPFLSIMMFEGLMSRWTIPFSYAQASAFATPATISTVSSKERRPRRFMRCWRSSPSTYSMAK